ncbi:Uncharacterised protein [Mycobacterium tuberculosis]|nr:Uncharacterised protein [Mycobacterium tuberculosis]
MLQGDHTVGGGFVVADAEMLFEAVEDGVAAHDGAQRVRAHTHQVLAGGAPAVHGVEAGHRRHLGPGQPELIGAEPQTRRRQVGILALHQVQQRQQRRAPVGIAADDLLGVDLQPRQYVRRIRPRSALDDKLVGFVRWRSEPDEHRLTGWLCHRSTPPMTGSMLATAAIKSATIPPSHIAATDCRLVKEGSR